VDDPAIFVEGRCGCNIVRASGKATEATRAEKQTVVDEVALDGCPDCNPNYVSPDLTGQAYHYTPLDMVRLN